MSRVDKELEVKELSEKFSKNNGMVITDYQGLTVLEISDLRSKLRSLNCEYKVVKNTLGRFALKNVLVEGLSEHFNGPTAVAIENGDPVSVAKLLTEYSKEHVKLKIKAGVLGTKMLSVEEITSLATLPSREVLIAKLLGTMNAPITNFVSVLSGTARNFVNVLDAIRKQKTQ